MFTRNGCVWILALAVAASTPLLACNAATTPASGDLGTPATPRQISGWNIDVEPNGMGLPRGSGTPSQGASLFATNCAACHGADGEGKAVPGHGMFPRLVGGIGTLASNKPIKTVGSFWPYATGVFDYIRRAMPFNHPQSLTGDQVYALTAFLLWKNGIIAQHTPMNAKSLPKVKMPNAGGFFTRPPPETSNAASINYPPFQRSESAGGTSKKSSNPNHAVSGLPVGSGMMNGANGSGAGGSASGGQNSSSGGTDGTAGNSSTGAASPGSGK